MNYTMTIFEDDSEDIRNAKLSINVGPIDRVAIDQKRQFIAAYYKSDDGAMIRLTLDKELVQKMYRLIQPLN